MSFLVSAFSVAKRGGPPSENRDATWPRFPRRPLGDTLASRFELLASEHERFIGIADGASEGLLAGPWAKIMLRALGRADVPVQTSPELVSRIERGIITWRKFKARRSENGNLPLTNLPSWLEDEAVLSGAFTTLCGAWITGNGNWTCIAVGDSCLFHTRHNELLESWPLTKSCDFDNSPYLIGSENAANAELERHAKFGAIRPEREDKIFFATDALAAWILQQSEGGEPPWGLLASFDPDAAPDDFCDFVEAQRDAGQMRNDDTTLLTATFTPA
jgi:hypothetical protein